MNVLIEYTKEKDYTTTDHFADHAEVGSYLVIPGSSPGQALNLFQDLLELDP